MYTHTTHWTHIQHYAGAMTELLDTELGSLWVGSLWVGSMTFDSTFICSDWGRRRSMSWCMISQPISERGTCRKDRWSANNYTATSSKRTWPKTCKSPTLESDTLPASVCTHYSALKKNTFRAECIKPTLQEHRLIVLRIYVHYCAFFL